MPFLFAKRAREREKTPSNIASQAAADHDAELEHQADLGHDDSHRSRSTSELKNSIAVAEVTKACMMILRHPSSAHSPARQRPASANAISTSSSATTSNRRLQ